MDKENLIVIKGEQRKRSKEVYRRMTEIANVLYTSPNPIYYNFSPYSDNVRGPASPPPPPAPAFIFSKGIING